MGILDSITNTNSIQRETLSNFYGVYVGIVTNNKSPDGVCAVQVRLPWLSNGEDESTWWARVCMPGAGKDRGMFWLPEVDDEVCVAFERGRISHPIVLCALYSKNNQVYEKNSDQGGKNDKRVLQSRAKNRIELFDGSPNSKVTVTSTKGHTVCMDDAGTITVKTSDGNHSIVLDQGGKIECKTTGDFIVDATKNIKMKAGINVEVESGANTTLLAKANWTGEAKAKFLLKGAASGEIDGGPSLKIHAGIVNIN